MATFARSTAAIVDERVSHAGLRVARIERNLRLGDVLLAHGDGDVVAGSLRLVFWTSPSVPTTTPLPSVGS